MSDDSMGSYNAYWVYENKVAYLEFIGDLDADKIVEANTYLRDNYLAVGDAPVHAIVNAANLTSYPTNIKMLQKSTAIVSDHPNMGWVILLGFDNPVIKFFSSAIAQILKLKFKQTDSITSAKEILQRIDPTLVFTET